MANGSIPARPQFSAVWYWLVRSVVGTRSRQRHREYQESLCHASDWPEAFSNGLTRARVEAREEARMNAEIGRGEYAEWGDSVKPSTFFADWVREIERTQVIYGEVMREAEEKIARIRAAALGKVADRLAEEYGESETVQALRENNPEYLTCW